MNYSDHCSIVKKSSHVSVSQLHGFKGWLVWWILKCPSKHRIQTINHWDINSCFDERGLRFWVSTINTITIYVTWYHIPNLMSLSSMLLRKLLLSMYLPMFPGVRCMVSISCLNGCEIPSGSMTKHNTRNCRWWNHICKLQMAKLILLRRSRADSENLACTFEHN